MNGAFGFLPFDNALITTINFDDAFPFPVKMLATGDRIGRVVVRVDSVFNSGVTITIGFTASPSEITGSTQTRLQKLRKHTFFIFRDTVSAETVQVFKTGTATQGSFTLFVEEL